MRLFHEAFAHALLAEEPDESGPLAGLLRQPGFAVYRNTVLRGCIDALEGNFPSVARLVGSDWFRSAALAYVRAQPPQDARLLAYGDDGFAAFLQALPTTAGLPYLSGVARLDGLWRAAHAAADAPLLRPGALAGVDPQTLAQCVLQPHPATRWAWFYGLPVATVWLRQREQASHDGELPWDGDGLLLTRRDGAVQAAALSRAGCALLDACAAGKPLGEAAAQAVAADAGANLATVLAQLLEAGAFSERPSVGFTSFTATLRNTS